MQSSLIVNLERKSATTLSFPGLSKIVISNSCKKNNHLVTLPLVTGFSSKIELQHGQCVKILGTR